jgi:tetratricopeptide (TPR) repeat protein
MTPWTNEDGTTLVPALPDINQLLIDAINCHNGGQSVAAERLYQTILSAVPNNALANYGFGLLRASQNRHLEAIGSYRRALAARPDFVDAYINLGTTHLTLGQREEAVGSYRQAIAIDPRNAMAHSNLGKALQDLGRIDEALATFRVAIALRPDDATVNVNHAAALMAKQAWSDALAATRRAIALQPDNIMAHANMGTILMNLGRYDDALTACREAIARRPRDVTTLTSLGGAMLELGAITEAAALCRDAISLDRNLPGAWFNLSHAQKALNQLHEAEFAARQAIALRPDSPDFHFHLAHILLLRGDMTAGWAEYQWRWRLPAFAWASTMATLRSRPLWTGEDLRDRSILIYTEQGLGDIILFARYLRLVAERARQVFVAVQSPVRQLLTSISGVTVVSIDDDPLPAFDVQCPLLNLPGVFATTVESIPATVPYLRSPSADLARRCGAPAADLVRVGIVWAGNPATPRDRFRSPGLANILPLFKVTGVEFIILQIGSGRDDLNTTPLPVHVIDPTNQISDLADTAAIMEGLDLMISSCTAPLHLAGALGVPTWAMIPFAPYFPWLLGRTDTPWYPTMRLYRQQQPGRDWSDVIDLISADLAALVAAREKRTEQPDVSQSTHTPGANSLEG